MISVQPSAPDSNKTNPLGVECGEYTGNCLKRPWLNICSVTGVHAGDLGGGEGQLGLFDAEAKKRARLNRSLDAIAEKFGPSAVLPAHLLRKKR